MPALQTLNNLACFLEGRIVKAQWMRAFQLKCDYEALSEMARFIDFQLGDLNESERLRFFEMDRKSVIRDPVFSLMDTDFKEGFPESLGGCLTQISDEDWLVFQEYLASRMGHKIELGHIENVVFSGGGGKGLAYPGVISALDETKHPLKEGSLLDHIQATSGASAGALISVPLALGYNAEEIESIVYNNEFGHFFDESSATSPGYRKEITRLLKKVSKKLRVSLSEIDYLDEFTRSMNRQMLMHLAQEQSPDNADQATIDSTYHELRTVFHVMTHHDQINLASYFHERGLLDQWNEKAREHASETVKDRFLNRINKHYPDFIGFEDALDAMTFSMRRFSGADNIEEFIGDLIEDKINRIHEKKLEQILPSVTTDADYILARNVSQVIDRIATEGVDVLNDHGYTLDDPQKWRRAMEKMITRQSSFWSQIRFSSQWNWNTVSKQVPMDDKELNCALAALSDIDDQHLIQLVRAHRREKDRFNPDQWAKPIQKMLPSRAFAAQRRLYKRHLNFSELKTLKEKAPEHQFKDLYITMCRLGQFDPKDLLLNPKRFLDKRYNLAMASPEDDEHSRMPIKTAARISMNLPVGFEKKNYSDYHYIDGGVVSNCPTHPFINDEKKGHRRTLVCLLGDNGFFESGRHLKESLKNWQYSARDKFRMIHPKNWLMPVQKMISWACYVMNPNYEKISNDDLWRSIIVETGDVGLTDFSIKENDKKRIIEHARKQTRSFLMNQDDAQLTFLNARLSVLEEWLSRYGIEIEQKQVMDQNPLRPGVFSTGTMKSIHKDMVSKESVIAEKGHYMSDSASKHPAPATEPSP